jgi:hypothetical protein
MNNKSVGDNLVDFVLVTVCIVCWVAFIMTVVNMSI